MNDMQKLKYDLTMHCASIMVQHDISSCTRPQGIYDVRNKMIYYATKFAEILTDGTMSEDSLINLMKYFS